MPARAYPYERLSKLSRAQCTALNQAAQRLPLDALGQLERTARGLFGAVIGVQTLGIEHCGPGQLARSLDDPVVVVLLAPALGSPTLRAAIEVEPRLGACVIDRALGGEAGETVGMPTTHLNEAELGVLAYVASRLLTESSSQAWRLSNVLSTRAAVALAMGDGGHSLWSLDVTIGQDRGVVRVWLPDGLPAQWSAPAPPARLQGLRLQLVVEAARGTLQPAELRDLSIDDLVVLEESWLVPNRGATAGAAPWGGQVRVRLLGANSGAWLCRMQSESSAQGAAIVAELLEREPLPPTTRGRTMQRDEPKTQALQAFDDAPIEVTLELGRFNMSLGELSKIHVGEVIVSGRGIGEAVTLSAGGRAVASGELVDVDGEVGVRVLKTID